MVTFLKMFQSKNGTSSDLITAAIIPGSPNTDYNKLRIIFVEYAQVYISTTNSTTNSTKKITVGSIELSLSNNGLDTTLCHYLPGNISMRTYVWN